MVKKLSDRHIEDLRFRRGIIDGDEDILAEFYEKYFSRLYRYIYYRVGRDHQHAEEVVNDTFVESIEKIEKFDSERGNLEAWLIILSRNKIRSLNNSMRRATNYERSWSMLEGELDTIFSSISDISEQEAYLENEELSNAVGLVMGSLPEDYSQLLELKYKDELSTKDIAARLKKTEKSIESKLTRARAAFRQLFTATNADIISI